MSIINNLIILSFILFILPVGCSLRLNLGEYHIRSVSAGLGQLINPSSEPHARSDSRLYSACCSCCCCCCWCPAENKLLSELIQLYLEYKWLYLTSTRGVPSVRSSPAANVAFLSCCHVFPSCSFFFWRPLVIQRNAALDNCNVMFVLCARFILHNFVSSLPACSAGPVCWLTHKELAFVIHGPSGMVQSGMIYLSVLS